ncbi:B12-binding domain-containing protein [Mediterraneibacter agrestimuris]|uniref:B12-binding domain-containing protein n=1 Tax=Mediterraneibacter agrestimuris TaxID=2941333 RepID=UPI002F3FEEC0
MGKVLSEISIPYAEIRQSRVIAVVRKPEEGLLSRMMIIGAKFKNIEVFVSEVLVVARAMNAGLTVLEPKLVEVGNEPVGKAVIRTIQGDLHDIGKNLVVMMLQMLSFLFVLL